MPEELIDAQQRIIDLDSAAPIFNLDDNERGGVARGSMQRLSAAEKGA